MYVCVSRRFSRTDGKCRRAAKDEEARGDIGVDSIAPRYRVRYTPGFARLSLFLGVSIRRRVRVTIDLATAHRAALTPETLRDI